MYIYIFVNDIRARSLLFFSVTIACLFCLLFRSHLFFCSFFFLFFLTCACRRSHTCIIYRSNSNVPGTISEHISCWPVYGQCQGRSRYVDNVDFFLRYNWHDALHIDDRLIYARRKKRSLFLYAFYASDSLYALFAIFYIFPCIIQ